MDDIRWVKSTACGDHHACVEVGWRKSSRSWVNGNCVEVAGCACGGDVLVRDSKDNGAGPVLSFSRETWREFVAGVRAGDWD